jgi:hypothetical protein
MVCRHHNEHGILVPGDGLEGRRGQRGRGVVGGRFKKKARGFAALV